MNYKELEDCCTATSKRLFRRTEGAEKEAYRKLTLRIRLACKKAWEELGKELPNYHWEDPDEI